MNSRRATRIASGLMLLLGVTACATAGDPMEDTDRGPTILEVDNQSTFMMNIYVIPTSGSRRRLGQARALTVTRLTIPENLVFGISALRFQADPIGSSRAPISDEIAVTEGDVIRMTIPP